ncbi:MAG: hypothetical protein K6F63_02755 [Lachnospiraceae bacterium]|nr:hypothetical protein [Lachnospiraceae bacterium]
MARQKTTKIKQRKEVNIGVVIFLFVLVYLIINVYVPLSKTEISIYEVSPGKLYARDSFKGMIVREESVYSTPSSGYINYYFKEGDKICKNESVYSVGTDKTVYERLNSEKTGIKLSTEETADLKDYINQTYSKASDFEDYSVVHDEILQYYRRTMDNKVMIKLNEIIAGTGLNAGFSIVNSERSGIISYYIDNYSNVNTTNFNNSMFEEAYTSEYTYKTDMFEAGNTVYKLITSDDWNIIVKLSDEMYSKLQDKTKVSFTIDSAQKLTAPVTFMKAGNVYYAVISMNHYVANYTKERFVDISFDTDENSGLKIPVSALAYKDYYRIPASYFMTYKSDDGTVRTGLTIERIDEKTGEKTYGFFETKIFWTDQGYNYVSTDLISSGEYITKPDHTESSMLYLFTVKLEGAYNINNGYAVFKRVERLETGTEYVLAKKDTVSGLSAYDHIALKAGNVVEGAVIY